MEAKKILFVSQEIMPYLPESEMSHIGRKLPQGILEKGKEIRTFMPRFGGINERRHQLHEVIRLSGMNIIINGVDHPLLIKVASIQSARMQVYFIDNDDLFARKGMLRDEKGHFFRDNDERIIFFTRGLFETVKKLRWNPDLIYCQGLFSSLIPLYLKREFVKDPCFAKTKVVYSCYDDHFKEKLDEGFAGKMLSDHIKAKDVALVKEPTHANINKLAIQFSDGVILHGAKIAADVKEFAEKSGKPLITYSTPEEYIGHYNDFFDQLLD